MAQSLISYPSLVFSSDLKEFKFSVEGDAWPIFVHCNGDLIFNAMLYAHDGIISFVGADKIFANYLKSKDVISAKANVSLMIGTGPSDYLSHSFTVVFCEMNSVTPAADFLNSHFLHSVGYSFLDPSAQDAIALIDTTAQSLDYTITIFGENDSNPSTSSHSVGTITDDENFGLGVINVSFLDIYNARNDATFAVVECGQRKHYLFLRKFSNDIFLAFNNAFNFPEGFRVKGALKRSLKRSFSEAFVKGESRCYDESVERSFSFSSEPLSNAQLLGASFLAASHKAYFVTSSKKLIDIKMSDSDFSFIDSGDADPVAEIQFSTNAKNSTLDLWAQSI